MTEPFEWDASTYDALPLPHLRWGEWVVGTLAPASGALVLDLGAGTGRDTERVLDAAPGVRVVAVDASERMLERLRERVTDRADRVRTVRADLRQPLPLDEPADAAMSVAALHWVPDHASVFRNVAAVLRPGARFVADCGGAGNVARFRAAVRAVDGSEAEAWTFEDPATTVEQLEAAGFTDARAELVEDPARLERGEQLEAFLATVMLPGRLASMPPADRRDFVRAVAAAMPEPVIDYVRLRFTATRSS